jgi:hypothetical protein
LLFERGTRLAEEYAARSLIRGRQLPNVQGMAKALDAKAQDLLRAPPV